MSVSIGRRRASKSVRGRSDHQYVQGAEMSVFATRYRRIRGFRRAIATGGLIVAAAACNDEARVEVDYQRDQIVPRAQTVVTLEDGVHRYFVTGQALTGSGSRPSYSTLNTGVLRVSVSMTDATGAITTGRLSLPLRADNGYGISIAIDSANPARSCLGCGGSTAFPFRASLARSLRDSMWLNWGSNSISNPVTF